MKDYDVTNTGKIVNQRWYDDVMEFLADVEDFLDNYADADHNGISFVPNAAMSLQVDAKRLRNDPR